MALCMALCTAWAAAAGLGGGPIKCDVASSCPAGATCCATPGAKAGEWGCCGAPNATCCSDMLHCCPSSFPVCGAGKCTAAAGPGGAAVPWVRARTGSADSAEELALQKQSQRDRLWRDDVGLGRPPPPTPPPPLYPFQCTTTRIGCFAEVPTKDSSGHLHPGDGWANRTIPTRGTVMPWGMPMSVTACARYCYQGMDLVDWKAGASRFNVTLAGNHLCGCSAGVPPTESGLPKRLPDSQCDAACLGNSSEVCGDANQTAASAYSFECTVPPTALTQPICNLNFSQWWNGSVVSYKQYIDCFAKSDTAYDSLYVNDHFAIQPHTALLCNVTHDPFYCETAAEELRYYALAGAPATGYHCYEIVLAFASVRDGTGKTDAGLSAEGLANFTEKVLIGCGSAAGHSAKVENHALDSAIQEAYAPRIFPGLLQLSPKVASWKAQAEMVYENWMHGHSLDESAINYDGISIVRLVALLRLGASDNPSIASMPGGPADLKSEKFKGFLTEFADAITPAGCLSNHGPYPFRNSTVCLCWPEVQMNLNISCDRGRPAERRPRLLQRRTPL